MSTQVNLVHKVSMSGQTIRFSDIVTFVEVAQKSGIAEDTRVRITVERGGPLDQTSYTMEVGS